MSRATRLNKTHITQVQGEVYNLDNVETMATFTLLSKYYNVHLQGLAIMLHGC